MPKGWSSLDTAEGSLLGSCLWKRPLSSLWQHPQAPLKPEMPSLPETPVTMMSVGCLARVNSTSCIKQDFPVFVHSSNKQIKKPPCPLTPRWSIPSVCVHSLNRHMYRTAPQGNKAKQDRSHNEKLKRRRKLWQTTIKSSNILNNNNAHYTYLLQALIWYKQAIWINSYRYL